MAGKQRDADSSTILTFIHAPDSLLWAKFFQTKLLTDNYNIPSSLHPPYLTPDFFSSSTSSSPSSSSSSSHKRLCALIVSPELLEPSHAEFWASYVQQQKGPSVAILLGVQKQDLTEALGKSTSAPVLAQPWVEVVDRETATISLALVKLIEMYEAAERRRLRSGLAQESFEEEDEEEDEFEEEEVVEEVVVEEEEESLEEKLERMKKYEDEEGGESPYMDPPPPRQQNDIMKVMPAVLYQGVGSREVVVVMRREAEKQLTMVLQAKEGAPHHHLPLQHLVSSTYVATLPNDIHGRVAFCVMHGEHTIGCASVCIRSRLDLMQALLAREISPVALLCKAVGRTEAETTPTTSTTVRDFQIEELDKVLAHRLSLSQLPPGLLGLLNDEELETSAEQEPEYNSQSQWPTLLHFAAEFNLVRVCEALLEYPGMIHAACTENVQGLFPCMVAERRGFKSLHSQLVQYVEEMSTHAGQRKRPTDSGISFPPETLPPPKPHGSHSPSYVNEGVRATAHPLTTPDAEEDVDTLGMMYASSKKRSFSEGCVKIPYLRPPSEDRIAEEEDGCDTTTSPPALKPKMSRARSDLHERVLPATHNRPLPPRPPGHSDPQHSLTGSEQINSQQCSSRTIYPDLNTPYSTISREAAAPAQAEARGKDCDVTSGMKPWREDSFDESRRGSSATISSKSSHHDFETLTEEDATVLRLKTKRSKSLQEKLSHFFHKMKPRSHRSSSETNLAALGKGQKKATVYVRASTTSTRSDPTSYSTFALPCGMSSGWMGNERDSGAVCDEKSSMVQLRSKKKSKIQNTGKRKGTLSSSGKKRMSVRVQRAKAEDLSETPSLPGRTSSKPEDSRL